MRNKNNRKFANEKGLTLMEVMIAVLLLSLIAMTFLHVFMNAFDNSIKAQEVTNYTYATQAKLEELRGDTLSNLINSTVAQDGNAPFDINGDGVDDCYMHFNISPRGISNEWATGKKLNEPTFAYLLYIGDKVLVLAEDGDDIIYTSAKVSPTIHLDLTPSGKPCAITVNGKTVNFNRAGGNTDVGISAFLNYKDFGYNSYLDVEAPSGHVYINGYGTEAIMDEFEASKEGHMTEVSGIMNSFPFLFQIKVELFHEEDDTVAFYDMSTLIDISFKDIMELAESLD